MFNYILEDYVIDYIISNEFKIIVNKYLIIMKLVYRVFNEMIK